MTVIFEIHIAIFSGRYLKAPHSMRERASFTQVGRQAYLGKTELLAKLQRVVLHSDS